MTYQPETSEPDEDLCDIRLLRDEMNRERYACGQCKQLAINTKVLNCNDHDMDLTLYCENCAVSIQSANKCPIDDHNNPTFSNAKIWHKIKNTVQFQCPYSAKIAIQNKNEYGNVIDTADEGKKQYQAIAHQCQWTGSYDELQKHVKNCTFRPKEAKEMIEIKNKMYTLEQNMNTSLDDMKDKITSFSELVNESKNEQNLDEQIKAFNGRINELRDDFNGKIEEVRGLINELKNERKQIKVKPAIKSNTANDWSPALVLSVFCCILLSVMGYYFNYQHHQIVSRVDKRFEDLNNIMPEMRENITRNVQNMKEMQLNMDKFSTVVSNKMNIKINQKIKKQEKWSNLKGDHVQILGNRIKTTYNYYQSVFGDIVINSGCHEWIFKVYKAQSAYLWFGITKESRCKSVVNSYMTNNYAGYAWCNGKLWEYHSSSGGYGPTVKSSDVVTMRFNFNKGSLKYIVNEVDHGIADFKRPILIKMKNIEWVSR